MFNWFKKKIPARNSASNTSPTCIFGSVDIASGYISDGYIDKRGEMKFKRTNQKIELWSAPVYCGIIDISWNLYGGGLFQSTRMISTEHKSVALYKQTHNFNGTTRYYYNEMDKMKFIDGNAYEKDGKIVFL